jgi:hypothetical protein
MIVKHILNKGKRIGNLEWIHLNWKGDNKIIKKKLKALKW